MKITKRSGLLGLLGLFVVGAAVVLSYSNSIQSGVTVDSSAGGPTWPWQSGGILYQRPKFGSLAYKVVKRIDPSVPKGQSLLLQPGQPGFAYGVQGLRQVVTPPKNERVVVGTATAHRLTIAKKTYYYDRVLTMMTTAYNGSYAMNGPSGAVAAWNGQPLVPGDVAVDPSVIPLGTYLYVQGYGLARAVDTGSAIVGDHIDLYFNEPSLQISRYGIRFEKVYVLGPLPPASVTTLPAG